jgi:7,8-dihydropterin-6-yl-methyl-4-(beta-D-ribofuranosyl)aminobenzene 5'-phosphate synthase
METLTIIYDNRAYPGLKPDWGFSLILELEDTTILFDTGAKKEVFYENAKLLECDISSVETVFISHLHWDHTGLLEEFRKLEDVDIILPDDFPQPTRLSERIITTGSFETGIENARLEHGLIVKFEEGAVLITGCSHPGIVKLAERAVEIVGEKLLLVIGGFHLYSAERDEILRTAQELKDYTEFTAPCHCTGEEGIKIFKEVFKDRFIDAKAGLEIPFA